MDTTGFSPDNLNSQLVFCLWEPPRVRADRNTCMIWLEEKGPPCLDLGNAPQFAELKAFGLGFRSSTVSAILFDKE